MQRYKILSLKMGGILDLLIGRKSIIWDDNLLAQLYLLVELINWKNYLWLKSADLNDSICLIKNFNHF